MEGAPFFNTENSKKIQINFVGLSLSIFPFLERTPLVWRLHLVGDFSTIRTHCRAAGIRIHLLSAALLVRSPEGRRVYCMCIIPRGTTLVVLLHRRGRIARSSSTTFRRGRNPVIGLQGPGGLQASSWICAASGIAGTTTPTMFMRERFPLNGLHTGM